METSILEIPHTPEELLTMPDGDRYELVDGRLVERDMGAQSSRIATILIRLLDVHATAHNLGLVFTSECGYQIFGDRPHVRFPDVSFIARGRLPDDRAPAGHVRIPPDLVVEVVSPRDTACELDQKVEDYLQAGIRLLWVVYPSTRRVMVYRKTGGISRLGPADELSGEDVLPGLTCRVADLFAGI